MGCRVSTKEGLSGSGSMDSFLLLYTTMPDLRIRAQTVSESCSRGHVTARSIPLRLDRR